VFGAQEEDDFKVLWEDGQRVFRRGCRRDAAGNSKAILALAAAAEHPTPSILESFAREYELRNDLDKAWAVRPLDLVQGSRTVLVLEDPGGEPLDRLLGDPMEMGRFLDLAIGIISALGMVHRHGLIHKDVKPANILVNCADGQVRLTGFGIASRLPRERQTPEPPEFIAGTLPYMAPEQTGRMNRSIDPRSDLYSFGVTLYEMLTGGLPFTASDPMEWVHCHIARQAVSPVERSKNIPSIVSAIVMKLLAKTPEDRYQTAAGVAWDLQRCLADWETAGHVIAFALGTHDRTQQLVIPEKLYGRDVEISTLLRAFERVVGQASLELVVVSGYSGIGKSSVVNELHKVIVPPRGIFIAGKYDQRLRDIPYSTLTQAFQGLIRQILNGRHVDADRWRESILAAVGKHGRLLTDLIPELTILIGPQPPVPVLSSFETQLRFQSVFHNFVGVFARAEHPLVIFIDDLQWLDPATLTVIESLTTHPHSHHLLLIGAYRDNEVGPDHPLRSTLGIIRESGTTVHEIRLGPLSIDDFAQLLRDALGCGHEEVLPLATLVHDKTGGNPFFAGQFLTNLAEEGLVGFESNSMSWRWDLQWIEAKGFTDNVVDLMVRRLQRLSPAARQALKQLACLGSQADFGTLAKILGGSEAEVRADFADALSGGVIQSIERNFKFVHDRVQEAAYALIPSESRADQHLRIGQMLLSSLNEREISERIFDVVNQLNLGSKLIFARSEQQRSAALNLQAAKKAKASTAYSSACRYLAAATAILGQRGWEECYDLTFSVCFERAECEFLSSNFGEAADWIVQLLLRAQSKVERAQAYQLRMTLQLVRGDNEQAVRTALECLQMFGIELPERPTNDQVHAEYDAVWSNMGLHPIRSLLGLPLMEDPEMRAVMNVFSMMYRSAYFIDTNLCQTIACRMVNVTQKHGTTDGAVIAYALLSVYLGPIFHRYADGEEFARLAVAVAEKHGFVAQKAGANFGMQMAVIWTQPIAVALNCLDEAISSAKETGEIIYACYSLEHRLTDRIASGDHLDEIWLEAGKALEFVERIKFRHVADIISSTRLFIQSLRAQGGDPAATEEAALEARLLEGGIPVVVCFHWILQIQRHFLLGSPEAALECANKAKSLIWSARCHIQFANYCLYYSVALAAVYSTASHEMQAKIRSELGGNIQALEKWAQSCPVTFAHKHLLVCGELARLDGREMAAIQFYERAALAAAEHGFVQDQGLANELAGQCCLASGAERAARGYLREARDCYLRWGALRKVAQLDERYPASKPVASPISRATIEESTERLDIATIVKTAQAISSEMVLEDLIKSLMIIAVEHAGAERGLLILAHGREQRIEAEALIQGGAVRVQLPEQSFPPSALPQSIVHHVMLTREKVILDDAGAENPFSADPYIRQKRARSVLCLPLLKQAKLVGMLYLENGLAPGIFTSDRISLLNVLASQAAISLENTRLYRELEQREAKIRRLVDANIIGIFIGNLEGRIVEANDALLRIVGYDREDLVTGHVQWTDLTPPEWRERDALAIEGLRATGAMPPYEKEYFRKDGSRVWVLIGGALFEQGANQGVAFVLDLTERKLAEAEARNSENRYREVQTELAHTNRVAAMGQLMASIAHEIRQPLSAVKMSGSTALRWLERNPPEIDEAKQSIENVVKDARRANDVISRIQGFVKKVTPSKDTLDINEAILEVTALIRSEAVKHRVAMQMRLADNLPKLQGDRVQLQQVMINLIINAIQAMTDTEGVRELHISTERNTSDEVRVAVQDSGPGLSTDKLPHLFKPFYTTKPDGMGMGLSISRSIIEDHGGQLWASEHEPNGALFQFTIPVS